METCGNAPAALFSARKRVFVALFVAASDRIVSTEIIGPSESLRNHFT